MKSTNQSISILIFCLVLVIGFNVSAQRAYLFGPDVTVSKNDTVRVYLEEYDGFIQWQRSFDALLWEDLIGETADTLFFVADTTSYIRAMVTAGDCDPFISDTTLVSVYRKSDESFFVDDKGANLISNAIQLAQGIYIYDKELNDVEIGSVLVSSEGTGYLRKVTSIEVSNNQTILHTEQAVFIDVVEEINLTDSLVITMSDNDKAFPGGQPVPVEVLYLIPGAKIDPQKAIIDLTGVGFSFTLPDSETGVTGEVSFTIENGHIDFEPVFYRELDVRYIPLRINRFALKTGGYVDFEMDLKVAAEIQVESKDTISLFRMVTGPIMIGPVPMLIETNIIASVSYGFNVAGDVSFGFESSIHLLTGAIYDRQDDPRWTPVLDVGASFNQKPFDFGLSASAYGQMGVGPRFDVTIAGLAGPYFLFDPYLRCNLSANYPLSWDFSLRAGVNSRVGFKVGMLGRTLIDFYRFHPGPYWTFYESSGFFDPLEPTVETYPITNITQTSASGGGNVTDDAGFDVITRGLIWHTSSNPTLDSYTGKTSEGGGTGEFFSNLTGLSPGTRYYVRAYASNAYFTGYGNVRNFWTDDPDDPGGFICGESTITDVDGNTYNTVLIGNQCWMKENLKTTKYRNGSSIAYPGNDNAGWTNNTSGAYAWYNNNISWKNSYGALYNWHAVNNSNGLCPTGWRVPTYNDAETLEDYLGWWPQPGGKLKSTRTQPAYHPRWDLPNTGATNETGFSAYPGGLREANDGTFKMLGEFGLFWTSTPHGTFAHAYPISLMSENTGFVYYVSFQMKTGASVRCIKE